MQHTRKYFFCLFFSDIYIYIIRNKYTKKNQRYYMFFGAKSSSAHVAGLNPAGLAGSLV
jgi:hypothetical protein